MTDDTKIAIVLLAIALISLGWLSYADAQVSKHVLTYESPLVEYNAKNNAVEKALQADVMVLHAQQVLLEAYEYREAVLVDLVNYDGAGESYLLARGNK